MIDAPTILAIATLISSIGAVVSSLLNRGANAKTAAKVDVVAAHVNSKATADNAKIEALQQQNAALLVLLANNKEVAALLAQSAAIAGHVTPAAPSVPSEVIVVNEPNEPVPTTATKKP